MMDNSLPLSDIPNSTNLIESLLTSSTTTTAATSTLAISLSGETNILPEELPLSPLESEYIESLVPHFSTLDSNNSNNVASPRPINKSNSNAELTSTRSNHSLLSPTSSTVTDSSSLSSISVQSPLSHSLPNYTTTSLTNGICPYCLSKHPYQCLKSLLYETGKVFGTAYSIKTLLTFLLSLLRKSPAQAKYKHGILAWIEKLQTSIFSKDTLQFSTFLMITTFLNRFFRCSLSRYRQKDDKINALISGGISGLGILWDNPTRRQSIVLYLCIRAIHSLAHTLVRLHYIPNIISPLATRLWFGLANSFIIYGFIMEPAFLDNSYYRWILKMAGLPHEVLEWTIRDPTWARIFATNHQQTKGNEKITWPNAGTTTWNIGPCNPPMIHGNLAGRVDLPPITSTSLSKYLSITDPSINQILPTSISNSFNTYTNLENTIHNRNLTNPNLPVTKEENNFVRNFANQLWNQKIIDPHTVPSSVSFTSSSSPSTYTLPKIKDIYYHEGKHHHHFHSSFLAKKPQWLHAAMIQSIQDPRAYRRCDTVWHIGQPCVVGHTVDSLPIALRCLRVYTPVHVLPVLLFKYKELFSNPVPLLTKTSKGIFWSSAFLTGYVWMVKSMLCFFRTNRQSDDGWQAWVAGLLSFPSLLLENHHRATELMLYCAPKGLSIAYGLAARKGYVRYIPYWDILVFMIAMMCFAVTDRNDYGTSYKYIMNFILGPDKTTIADLPYLLTLVTKLQKLKQKIHRQVHTNFLTLQELVRL